MLNGVGRNPYTQIMRGTSTSVGKTSDARNEREAAEPAADELSLSSPTSLLQGAMSGLFGVEPRADGAIRIEDIQRAYEQRFEELTGSLSRLMKNAGVDRSQEAVLGVDRLGHVRVTNDHPDKEAIEQVFRDNPAVENQFRQVAGMKSFLDAAEKHEAFADAYAENPVAAVERFLSLFDEQRDSDFQMRISADRIVGETVPKG